MFINYLTKISCALCLFLFGCQNKRFIHKIIHDKTITVTWFYESYISSARDFIEVEKDRRKEIIMDMNSMTVTDILIKSDTILIKAFEPKNNIYKLKDSALGYYIKLDSNVSLVEYNKYYN